ncbi:MAG: Na+/glucose cotransporter [Armatimonadetes bacterium CG_4_10_14_3_um_filter_66_18]|nr:MAG: Na+/glucose cotransporter [Armatimonadetes bacterium CG_4_10_14_3_um_filter_66_18]
MQNLHAIDLTVFVLYFLVLIAVGLVAGRHAGDSSEDYFLAGRSLPWYVVGASFIGSNISTEHFIGMVGAAYVYGICVAQWEWGNLFAFSVLIWLFIPFLLASRVFTAPEFLERRYNPTCRLLFALLTVVANITAFLAAVLYAAALGLQEMFGWPLWVGVVVMAVTAGSYAIYGGLRSVAWTDLFQTVVMVLGGVLVTLLGLRALGDGAGVVAGWHTMIARNLGHDGAWAAAVAASGKALLNGATYHRLDVFQPLIHPLVPWITIFTNWLAISIWYNCINQFMVQRVLAAKDDWQARMGIVLAMFMKIGLPFIVVIPGLIYFAMKPDLTDQQQIDKTYAVLVTTLVHVGLKGLLLAALFGAIQSTVDSVLNSTSTILTLDIYKKFLRPDVQEDKLARLGRWLSVAVLLIAVLIAPQIGRLGQGVFVYIQNLYAHFAPPFAALFLVGILWKRATGKAAVWTIVTGIAFSVFLQYGVFERLTVPVAFTLRSSITWLFCVLVHVFVSLGTAPPPAEKVTPDLTIDWSSIRLFDNLGTPWPRNLALWYGVGAAGMVACYVAFSGLFLK